MEAWETSRTGTETISRTTIVDNVRRTTAYNRPRSGKASFLNAAARISLSIAKLAGWTPRVMVPDAPQDSPFWQVQDEEGGGGVGGRDQEQRRQLGGGGGLIKFCGAGQEAGSDSEEMDAITAEREATCRAPGENRPA
jgi:hypothetical protein